MKLFSIITICRNNLRELILTSETVISQSEQDYEWIVVDGDSTDGTKDWLNSTPNQFKWISEKDNGIYDAMNKGIGIAEGKYLLFLNSGDAFADQDVLKKIKNFLKTLKSDPAFLYGDSLDMNEAGNIYYRKAKDHRFIRRGMITQHQAMLFNREKIKNLFYHPEYKYTADYALICDVIYNSNPNEIARVDFAICRFSMGGTNEIYRFKALKEDYQIRRQFLKLSIMEASTLYILHYIHTVLKKISPSLRFIKHK